MSEDEARSVGVRLGALRTTLFLLAGALSAGSVLLAGPIGFVGLVCPHLGRLLGGPSHRLLVVNSCILGGAVIVLADAGVRLIDLGAGRMPLGVLTALIGGPVFIAMLRREMLR
jgi:iron complex transport system permease protein